VASDKNRALQGMTVAELAAQRNRPAEEVVMDLLVEEQGRVSMVGFGMCEEDVRRVVAHPVGMIGSDAAAVSPHGVLGRGHPHPRTYGTFARVLGHYVRETKALSLEAAVAKMTSRPAEKLGLKDRGMIAAGMAADICVFDPEGIADRATYQEPQQYAAGVCYVLVNGVIEVEGEMHHGRRAGRVLARAG
jgi:N-acyl-D-amino-acid deacylase